MARGHFYPLPPPFIGGRQPYAPALGIPQSGGTLPPPRSLVNFNTINQSWIRAPYAIQYGAEIASTIPVVIPSAPPPASRKWLDSVITGYKDRQWTIIYTASIAPILAVPETIDAPPPKSYANLNLIVQRWKPPFPTYLSSAEIAHSIPAPIIDAPPKRDYVNLHLLRRQNIGTVWWPLPANIKQTPPSVVLQADPPPKRSFANLNTIIGTWKAPPARPVFKNVPSTESGPVPVGGEGQFAAHRPAHIRAVRRAVRCAHGGPNG